MSSERLLKPEAGFVAELYARYADWLRARLVRRYGIQDAEDLTQDTWVRLAPLEETKDVRHPKALLLAIARNLAADRFGQRAGRERLEREIVDTSGWGVEAETQTHSVILKELVLSLPQPLRDVFVLSRIGGLSNAQIGERLGISPKTVEWRMTKALAHCAAQLRR